MKMRKKVNKKKESGRGRETKATQFYFLIPIKKKAHHHVNDPDKAYTCTA
jgi:hypothetical protein